MTPPPPAVSNGSIIPLRDKKYRITLEEISQLTIPIAFDPGPIFDLAMSMTGQRPNFRKIGDLSNFSIFSSATVADINMRSSLASFLMNLGHFGVQLDPFCPGSLGICPDFMGKPRKARRMETGQLLLDQVGGKVYNLECSSWHITAIIKQIWDSVCFQKQMCC